MRARLTICDPASHMSGSVCWSGSSLLDPTVDSSCCFAEPNDSQLSTYIYLGTHMNILNIGLPFVTPQTFSLAKPRLVGGRMCVKKIHLIYSQTKRTETPPVSVLLSLLFPILRPERRRGLTLLISVSHHDPSHHTQNPLRTGSPHSTMYHRIDLCTVETTCGQG